MPLDIDMVLPVHSSESLEILLKTELVTSTDSEAFILPAFEILTEVEEILPRNKIELINLLVAEKAEQFNKDFNSDQGSINFGDWRNLPISSVYEVKVGYKLPNFDGFFNPVFLASVNSFIPFLEQFRGSEMARTTQV